MTKNIEDLKNKIIYRASYRGSKEMDISMSKFVKSIINDLNNNELEELDYLLNLDDESIYKIKNNILSLDKISVNLLIQFNNFKI